MLTWLAILMVLSKIYPIWLMIVGTFSAGSPHHKIQHCFSFSEANRCADALARMGAGMLSDFVSFDSAPVCILEQIRLDALGTLYSRRCNSSVVVF